MVSWVWNVPGLLSHDLFPFPCSIQRNPKPSPNCAVEGAMVLRYGDHGRRLLVRTPPPDFLRPSDIAKLFLPTGSIGFWQKWALGGQPGSGDWGPIHRGSITPGPRGPPLLAHPPQLPQDNPVPPGTQDCSGFRDEKEAGPPFSGCPRPGWALGGPAWIWRLGSQPQGSSYSRSKGSSFPGTSSPAPSGQPSPTWDSRLLILQGWARGQVTQAWGVYCWHF